MYFSYYLILSNAALAGKFARHAARAVFARYNASRMLVAVNPAALNDGIASTAS
jgi:hypothetical protein